MLYISTIDSTTPIDLLLIQVAQNIYIGGAKDMDREKYKEHEEFLDILNTYLDKLNNKKPEVG